VARGKGRQAIYVIDDDDQRRTDGLAQSVSFTKGAFSTTFGCSILFSSLLERPNPTYRGEFGARVRRLAQELIEQVDRFRCELLFFTELAWIAARTCVCRRRRHRNPTMPWDRVLRIGPFCVRFT
jgi:hypothetical protein